MFIFSTCIWTKKLRSSVQTLETFKLFLPHWP